MAGAADPGAVQTHSDAGGCLGTTDSGTGSALVQTRCRADSLPARFTTGDVTVGTSEQQPAEHWLQLREQALTASPQTFGMTVNADTCLSWAIVMDWTSTFGTATLVAVQNGNASLYLSNGLTLTGGGEREHVRHMAAEFVDSANRCIHAMQDMPSSELPDLHHITFHVRTPAGTLTATAHVDELTDANHVLSELSQHGQRVLSALNALARDSAQNVSAGKNAWWKFW